MFYVAAFSVFTMLLLQTAHAGESVSEFFNRYGRLNGNFDPSVADLYSDTAKIHTFRRYPFGLQRTIVLSGAQWKSLIVTIMPLAKAKNDISTTSNVTISRHGQVYKIKANRYFTIKCYTDTGYYMIVAQNELKKWQIVEEYMETQPQSDC
ncbi:hypothetical protein [Methylosinus sp. Sm6]|uniref:hypothetical protein n=1 Tax=Methylosinus sp. Sm6 TaxID=2866948 RepID=UPI001C996F75|nr:hypothetical protein [Methylosinus sp. Sm6]MBY6242968.1 hypothetical protein [Methylosinus sp. Sm6]